MNHATQPAYTLGSGRIPQVLHAGTAATSAAKLPNSSVTSKTGRGGLGAGIDLSIQWFNWDGLRGGLDFGSRRSVLFGLIYYQGLRRVEISRIVVEDFDSEAKQLLIHGKGRPGTPPALRRQVVPPPPAGHMVSRLGYGSG